MTEPDQKIIATWPAHEKRAIEAWCGQKINSFTGKEFNELDRELILIQRDVGVKQLLSDMEIERMIEKILDEFGDFTIKEITHAVNETIMGRLMQDGKPIDPQHYGEFGFLYLAKILRAYQIYRGYILRKYHEGEEEARRLQAEANKKPITEAEKRETMIRLALSNFDSFIEDKIMSGLHLVYDFLHAEGLIAFPEEKMQVLRDRALENTKRDAVRGNTAAKSILEVMKRDDTSAALEWQIKALAVKAYFSELKQGNMSLNELLLPKG